MKSTAIGSAVSVLLAFSAISYSKDYLQQQNPKPVQSTSTSQVQVSNQEPGALPANPNAESTKQQSNSSAPAKAAIASVNEGDFAVAPQTYMATAYSLRGRTASGMPVARGLIAADTSVLPLGTRVRVEAGSFSGEYVVADTGGSVRGHRIDIWTPTAREALQFGRRAVKVTVLSFGGRRAKTAAVRPRRANPQPDPSPVSQPTSKQDQ